MGKYSNIMKKTNRFLTAMLIATALTACNSQNSVLDEPQPQMNARTIEYPIKGDVNGDGKVTIADVTTLIDYIMQGRSSDNSDVNGDGVTTIVDVTVLIDMLMNDDGTQHDDGNYIVNGIYFKMVEVEGGTFVMGAKNTEPTSFTFEKPQHEVTLSTFSIGETEVTQELYQAVTGTNPSINKSNPQNPVEFVDWNDCITFIEKLNEITHKNFRLPTEAEWEYAAIGGKYTHYYLFSGSEKVADVAWYTMNSNGSTHPVKQLQPNEKVIQSMSWQSQYVIYLIDPKNYASRINISYSNDNIQDIIDIFSGMINSFDKNENSIAEAFCLANIIVNI